MLPIINIFGFPLPMYGLMALIGFVVALFAALKLTKVYELPRQDLLFSAVYMVIGIIVGAKLMYFITYIPRLIRNFDVFLENPW